MNKKLFALSLCISGCSIGAFFASSAYSQKNNLNHPPVINMEEREITISVKDPVEAVFQNILVTDPEDGDVTDSLLIEKMNNLTADHSRLVVLGAFDSKGNVSKVQRKIIYKDYHSPKFTLKSPLMSYVGDTASALKGIKVKDVLDGDITSQVQLLTDDRIASDVSDMYSAHLLVSNSAGDTVDLPVTFTAYTSSDYLAAPQIELEDYLIYVKKGSSKPNAWSYVKSVTVKNREFLWDNDSSAFSVKPDEFGSTDLNMNESILTKSQFKVDNPVDTNVPGVYEITYFMKEYKSNPAGRVRLIVVVQE